MTKFSCCNLKFLVQKEEEICSKNSWKCWGWWKKSAYVIYECPPKVKAYICDKCGQALSTRHGLRMHKLIHKEESKSIACSRCDKSFRHLSTYRKHIARVHDFVPEQRLKCEGCAKLFNHMEGLKRHMRKFHSGEKPQYQCDLCPMAFVFNYDLNKHKKRVHFVAIKW